MKKIIKVLFLSIFIITVSSCDNEDQELLTLSPKGSGEITAPETGYSFVLNPDENQTNTAFTLIWNSADYDVPTEVSYNVEFAVAGTDFATPYLAGSTTNNTMVWNIMEFNGVVISTGLAPFVEGAVDVRIVSTVGSLESTPQVSEAISIYVTPFTTDLPKISVPGNHQGWDPGTAPLLASSAFGSTDYEGYIWLDGGYKFLAPDETGGFFWGNTDWADDGSFTGILVEEDETDCIADPAGYYFVQADTDALTYATTAVSWGIIGEATPTGWESDTDLIYDSATKRLTVDIDLTPGAFKFRGNNDWGQFDLGTVDDDGFLQSGGDLTFEGSAGNYRVVLDLSNPREYTYSITPN